MYSFRKGGATVTKKPISKLNELAKFHTKSRYEYLQALIEREYSSLLSRIEKSPRREIYKETFVLDRPEATYTDLCDE